MHCKNTDRLVIFVPFLRLEYELDMPTTKQKLSSTCSVEHNTKLSHVSLSPGGQLQNEMLMKIDARQREETNRHYHRPQEILSLNSPLAMNHLSLELQQIL